MWLGFNDNQFFMHISFKFLSGVSSHQFFFLFWYKQWGSECMNVCYQQSGTGRKSSGKKEWVRSFNLVTESQLTHCTDIVKYQSAIEGNRNIQTLLIKFGDCKFDKIVSFMNLQDIHNFWRRLKIERI